MKCFDIAAPSQFVFTYSENQIEEVVWGTSVAAPLVSGVVALYISQNPDWYYGNTVNKTQAMKAILKEKLTRDLEYEYNGVTYSVPKLSASDMLVEEPQNPAYSGSLGSAAAWNYDSLSKKLTISGAGSLPDFQSSVSVPWYAYRKEIESAEVLNTDNNNGITNIPAFAFSHCEKITAVSLPSSVTHIGSHAFDTCRSLASISDTSNVAEIESFAFCNCSKLQGLSFSDGYTVVNDGTFMTCSSLNTFSLANITEIGDLAFAGCEGYNKTSAEVDYIDITDAVSIGKLAFAYCNTISNLKISSEVQALKYGTFWHCKSLLSIIIPNISAIEDYCFQANPHTNITVLGKVESAGDVSLNTDFLYVLNDIVSMADWAIAFGKVYCLPDTNISAYADSKGLNKEYLMQPINENCVIDRDLKLIYGLDAPLLQSKLFTEVLDVNVDYETVKAGTLRVGTGYKIILKDHNGNVLDEYTIIIFGDLNSDGSVNAKDASILAEIVSGIKPLPDGSAYYYAGDLTNFGDGLTQEDYEYLRQVINGTIELLQTPNYETVNN